MDPPVGGGARPVPAHIEVRRVGVDLGGTRLRVFLANGRRTRRADLAAVEASRLGSELKTLFKAWDAGRVDTLTVGARGVWRARERRALLRNLKGLARRTRVMSDLELAWRAAFEGRRDGGIVVLAGTGSAAYGQDVCGHQAREGGLGPLLGDEGSGFWIGREWLRSGSRSLRPRSAREVARLAPKVLRRSDPACRKIIRRAQGHLVDLAVRARRKLHFRRSVPVAWHGGLFRDRRFESGFSRLLRRQLPALEKVEVREAARWAATL